jgi:hypothetical protein
METRPHFPPFPTSFKQWDAGNGFCLSSSRTVEEEESKGKKKKGAPSFNVYKHVINTVCWFLSFLVGLRFMYALQRCHWNDMTHIVQPMTIIGSAYF